MVHLGQVYKLLGYQTWTNRSCKVLKVEFVLPEGNYNISLWNKYNIPHIERLAKPEVNVDQPLKLSSCAH